MTEKKITLETIDARFTKLEQLIERGFSAVAEDITDIKSDVVSIKDAMATKEQIVALHTQVNSMETQLRDMKHTKLQSRVGDLEEEVFGKTRA